MATIEGIFIAAKASQPMRSLTVATLVTGRGIAGDRYCSLEGTYSVFAKSSKLHPGKREPGRQLTMLSADCLEERLKSSGLVSPSSLGDLRRNLVVRGVSGKQLLDSVGHVVQIGATCRVLIHRHTVPCMYNERKNEIPGLMEAVWDVSGVSCEVLEGGPLSVGDAVTITEETQPVDDGLQSPGYYSPPSKRSAMTVREDLEWKRAQRLELETADPDGFERARASYASVGLTFWPRDSSKTSAA